MLRCKKLLLTLFNINNLICIYAIMFLSLIPEFHASSFILQFKC